MSELQTVPARTRTALQQSGSRLRTMQVSPEAIPAAAAVYVCPIGVVGVPGLRLDRFWVMTGTALVPDGTNYYTFKPWLSRPSVLGGMDKVYLGTPRSTLTLGLVAGLPVRMHDEYGLNAEAPVGSVVGVDVAITLTPASGSLLVRPLFQADFSLT